ATNVQVRVRVEGSTLTLQYLSPPRAELVRTVEAPARTEELPELAALLVANLARDEAAELLFGLARQPVPERDVAVRAELSDPGPAPIRTLDGFNLSLFHPLTLLRHTEQRRLGAELGLFYGRLGALSGAAVEAAGVLWVDGEAEGFQLGSLGWVNGGPASGLRVAGIFGIGSGSFDGGSVAGLLQVQAGDVSGAQVSFVFNTASGKLDGAQLSSGFNTAQGASGLQLALGLNLATAPVTGMQGALGLNLATGGLEGVQLGGVFNLATGGELEGAQVAIGMNWAAQLDGAQLGLGNVGQEVTGAQISLINVGEQVTGLQLGLINVAYQVKGLQLGLINVAQTVDGASVGIIPYDHSRGLQLVTWYDSTQDFNFGVRFQTGVLYVMPTLSYDRSSVSGDIEKGGASYVPGFSVGGRVPIWERAYVDLDVNYANPSNGWAYDEQSIDLRYRLIGGWQFSAEFGVFAGGGVLHHFRTDGQGEASVAPELSLGFQVL
ncbi:MAG TPA: hypothetical protein VJU61_11790, partial [Polyangiaceae bacterium]|nr:hypothetical protein [Polyangiaceae bacterium]